ncbi:MAG: hypothetical protein PVH80_07800 [Anaerolineae bacterium]|jgi:hypothetical protein
MSERLTILQLIESGQISVEEGVRRLEALEQSGEGGAAETEGALATSADAARPAFEPARPGFVRIVWQIVFGVGVAVLAGSGLLLANAYGAEGRPGLAWGWVLFTLGLLVMGLGWWLQRARWFYLRVREHDGPAFTIALPLPLGLVIWLLRVAKPFVPQLRGTGADELMFALREELGEGRPFVIDVDEGENGDRVEMHFC